MTATERLCLEENPVGRQFGAFREHLPGLLGESEILDDPRRHHHPTGIRLGEARVREQRLDHTRDRLRIPLRLRHLGDEAERYRPLRRDLPELLQPILCPGNVTVVETHLDEHRDHR